MTYNNQEQLREAIKALAYNYLYFHSESGIVELDASNEAGMIADSTIEDIIAVEKQYQGGV